jgi:hypothetical protein
MSKADATFADQRRAEERVRRSEREAGHHSQRLAEPVADIGEHAARGAELARHLDVCDREDGQDDRREEERRRRILLVARAHGEREVEHEDGERRRARDAEEEDEKQAHGAGSQLLDALIGTDVDRGDGSLVI